MKIRSLTTWLWLQSRALIQYNWCPHRKRKRSRGKQRECPVRTLPEGFPLEIKTEVSGETKPANSLILYFWLLEQWENTFLSFKLPTLHSGILLWQPKKTNIIPLKPHILIILWWSYLTDILLFIHMSWQIQSQI